MTWTINITGHDNLGPEEKEVFENGLVNRAREFAANLKSGEGVIVSIATVTTNTTGTVNLSE